MKNKKGFTLIELLAVIVVLAIIALIATPIVMNTIKNAKKGAAERTADNYIKQVETAVAESRIDGTKIANGTYNIQPDGNLCPTSGCGENDKDKITIDMSGNKPTSGTITIKNGEVSQDKSNVKIGDYVVSYDKDNNKQQAQELYKGILCTKASGVDLNNLTYGNEFTCELGDNDKKTFYVLEVSDDDVSLIMNANVGKDGKAITSASTDKGSVAWCTKEDYLAAGGKDLSNDNGICQSAGICSKNEYGPITAEKALKTNTKGWTKLSFTQITLPTANQLAKASGKTFNNEFVSELPTWLYDYLIGTTNAVPEVPAYWTSSTSTANDNTGAFIVTLGGNVVPGGTITDAYGIRPVITISKSNLS